MSPDVSPNKLAAGNLNIEADAKKSVEVECSTGMEGETEPDSTIDPSSQAEVNGSVVDDQKSQSEEEEEKAENVVSKATISVTEPESKDKASVREENFVTIKSVEANDKKEANMLVSEPSLNDKESLSEKLTNSDENGEHESTDVIDNKTEESPSEMNLIKDLNNLPTNLSDAGELKDVVTGVEDIASASHIEEYSKDKEEEVKSSVAEEKKTDAMTIDCSFITADASKEENRESAIVINPIEEDLPNNTLTDETNTFENNLESHKSISEEKGPTPVTVSDDAALVPNLEGGDSCEKTIETSNEVEKEADEESKMEIEENTGKELDEVEGETKEKMEVEENHMGSPVSVASSQEIALIERGDENDANEKTEALSFRVLDNSRANASIVPVNPDDSERERTMSAEEADDTAAPLPPAALPKMGLKVRSLSELQNKTTPEKRVADSVTDVPTKRRRVDREVGPILTLSDDEDADDPSPVNNGEDEEKVSNKAESEEETKQSSGCPSPTPSTSRDGQSYSSGEQVVRSFRNGVIETLTAWELEELMVQKLCETITDRSQTGELRRRVEALEDDLAKWKERALNATKHIRGLEQVLEKYSSEIVRLKLNGGKIYSPVKVTRSVGLQVTLSAPPRNIPERLVNSASNKVQKKVGKPLILPRIASKPKSPISSAALITHKAVLVSPPAPAKPISQYIPQPHSKSLAKPQLARVEKTREDNSGVIDLTDDDKGGSTSGFKTISTIPVEKKLVPGQKVAYIVNTGKGSGQIIFNPPPPQLMYKGTTVQPANPVKLHPAPLPSTPIETRFNSSWKRPPPRPTVKISNTAAGIVLSWDMTINDTYEPIASYQLYAYQENNQLPTPALWREVGDVKAMTLPMACTLTSFVPGHRYHFSVRAVDVNRRCGPFSLPGSISLNKT